MDDIKPKLSTITRDIIFLPQSHTWWQLTNAIGKAIRDHFGPKSLLACVTTDNGSNFVKASIGLLHTLEEGALSQLGPDDWDERIEVVNEYEDVGWRCVAHTMQLAVMDVLDTSSRTAETQYHHVILQVQLL